MGWTIRPYIALGKRKRRECAGGWMGIMTVKSSLSVYTKYNSRPMKSIVG